MGIGYKSFHRPFVRIFACWPLSKKIKMPIERKENRVYYVVDMLILREKSPSDLHPNGHAFLTWRCHDFRTMASIYMSHLYTRSPRYIVAISKSEILFDLSQDDKATGRKFQKSNGINAGRCIQFGKIGSATFAERYVNHRSFV